MFSARTKAWRGFLLMCTLSFAIILLSNALVEGAKEKHGGERVVVEKAQHFFHSASINEQIKPPTFMLFRLIGNNMPPLQSAGQLLWNTEYTLKHEGNFPDCQKRWVINQIVNVTEKQLILDLLKLHGYEDRDILVRELNYKELAAKPEVQWEVAVTAQNAGRNAAIENGKAAGVTWILPLDGNHFITNQAWRRIVRSAKWSMKAGHQYFKVPMYRVAERHDSRWLNATTTFQTAFQYAPLKGESQIAFHNSAGRHFPEGIRYGKRNKWNFIKEVCPYDPKSSGSCGCSDIYEEKIEAESNKSRGYNIRVATLCGYSLRLWMFPNEGVDGKTSILDWSYRGRLREQATEALMNLVSQEVQTMVHGESES